MSPRAITCLLLALGGLLIGVGAAFFWKSRRAGHGSPLSISHTAATSTPRPPLAWQTAGKPTEAPELTAEAPVRFAGFAEGDNLNGWREAFRAIDRRPGELSDNERRLARQVIFDLFAADVTPQELADVFDERPGDLGRAWMQFAVSELVVDSPVDLSKWLVSLPKDSPHRRGGIAALLKSPDLSEDERRAWENALAQDP